MQHISSGRGLLRFSVVSFRPVDSGSNIFAASFDDGEGSVTSDGSGEVGDDDGSQSERGGFNSAFRIRQPPADALTSTSSPVGVRSTRTKPTDLTLPRGSRTGTPPPIVATPIGGGSSTPAATTPSSAARSVIRRSSMSGLAGQAERLLGPRGSADARTFHDLATAIVEVQRKSSADQFHVSASSHNHSSNQHHANGSRRHVASGSQLSIAGGSQRHVASGSQRSVPSGSQRNVPGGSQRNVPSGSQRIIAFGSQRNIAYGSQRNIATGTQRHIGSHDYGNTGAALHAAGRPESVGSRDTTGKKTLGRLRRALVNQVCFLVAYSF